MCVFVIFASSEQTALGLCFCLVIVLMAACLCGHLSTSPVDSDLRWNLIQLDLSSSQGEGLEIGLCSDWIVSPWGKGTREVKKKTVLSYGSATQGSCMNPHAQSYTHTGRIKSPGRLQSSKMNRPHVVCWGRWRRIWRDRAHDPTETFFVYIFQCSS